MTPSGRRLALVTGASSGIGQAYAERLAADGWDLVAHGRREERLRELSKRLGEVHGAAVEVLVAELAEEAGVVAVERACRERPLAMLVNNAGMAHYKPFAELPHDEMLELVRADVEAVVRLSRAALDGMLERGGGTIVNLSSMLAFSEAVDMQWLPKRAVYAATRSFVVTFSRLLAEEVGSRGIRVQALCPGIVRTEFHQRQGIDLSQMTRMEPADVVQASLRGLEIGEVVCMPPVPDPSPLAARDAAGGTLLSANTQTRLPERYSPGS
jgi:short-subunit dehydrogenase